MRRSLRRGSKAEEYFLSRLQTIFPTTKATCNSGATFSDGDLINEFLLVDVKSSEGKDFPRITADDWQKIKKQAYSLGRDFIVPIITADMVSAIIMPEDLALEALAALFNKKVDNGCNKDNPETGGKEGL